MFNGLALHCLMWPNNIAALAWLPWLLYSMRQATIIGGRWLAAAAVIGALQLLTGAPEVILFSWLFVAGFVLATPLVSFGKKVLRTAIAASLAGLLSSVQLFPFLDLLMHSQRNTSFGGSDWSMPVWGWLNLVVPLFRSLQSSVNVFVQENQNWTSSYYPGVIVLALAMIAFGRKTTWLWLVAIVGLIMALGERAFLYTAVQKALPVLGFMRFPIKFVLLAVIAFPFLAAIAIASWQSSSDVERKRLNRRLVIAAGALSLVALVLCVVTYIRPYPSESLKSIQIQNGLSRIGLLIAGVTLLIRSGGSVSFRAQKVAGFGIVLLIWVDGWTHAPNQNPTVAPAVMVPNLTISQFAVPPALGKERAFMRKPTYDNLYRLVMSDPYQEFLLRRVALAWNCNLMDRVPTPDGFYSLYLPHQRGVWEYLFFTPTNRPGDAMLDFIGVSQMSVSSSSNVISWEPRPGAMPLATVGQRPNFLPNPQIPPLLFSTNFNPRDVVVLAEVDQSQVTVRSNSNAKIIRASVKTQSLVFDVEASEPTFLVCAQAFYHCWKAEVDGTPARIFKANGAFQAVEVPAGNHRVVFSYQDRAFFAGCLASGAGLLVLLVIWFKGNKRHSPPDNE